MCKKCMYVYLYTYTGVCVYSVYMYVYMHMSMYPSLPPLDVFGGVGAWVVGV